MSGRDGAAEPAELSTVEFQEHPSDAERGPTKRSLAIGIVLLGTLLEPLGSARPAVAQTTTTTTSATTVKANTTIQPVARLIEWDLPAQVATDPNNFKTFDSQPGAMVVDTQGDDQNRVWFVTRLANPNLYRLETPKSLMKANARWTAWQLDTILAGGLKRVRASRDRRYVFVRTVNSHAAAALERIDTQNCSAGSCEWTEWSDPNDPNDLGMDLSDVAVDDNNNVFTSHTPGGDPANSTMSYVQRLTPGKWGAAPTVTRWNVGGGAGLCGGGSSPIPCVAGIAVDPSNPNLVYYSEPMGNNIARLDTTRSEVRRWSLLDLSVKAGLCSVPCTTSPIAEPRQLQIDRWGKVWVVTGSGHIVSLDPCTNEMTSHQMPDGISADPFGVAPDDDAVGYTASDSGINKVGMLLPKGRPFCVPPSHTPICALPASVNTVCGWARVASGYVGPTGKTVLANVAKNSDGTYVEAEIHTNANDSLHPNDSESPLGLTPAKWQGKAQGTFFYAVGTNQSTTTDNSGNVVPVNRIGFVRLPIQERIKHPRDDDDANDGSEGENTWHNWHDHAGRNDDDDDGVENDSDSPSNENVQRGDSSPLLAGQTMDYPMTASATTLALIAKVEADDPLAQIGVEIHDANGLLVASSPATPGIAVVTVLLPAAGSYTCRVRNDGPMPVNHTPTLIVREPWLP
jgi:hypothetical protein